MSDDATLGPATTGSAVPATANTGAIPALGLDRQEGKVIPRKQVFSWALWDWATQPFNTVILTFIFVALYLTGDDFLPAAAIRAGEGRPSTSAPRPDSRARWAWGRRRRTLHRAPGTRARTAFGHRGGRKRWLAFSTGLLVLLMAALFFVRADPAYFLLGVGLVAVGTVVSEIAGVNYNAMLVSVSTPKTVGKVSGTGWGFGYIGGILALVIVVVANQMDWFGLSTDDGLPYRVIALGCALWTILFSIPLFLNVPDVVPEPGAQRSGFLRSYLDLGRDLVRLQRELKPTFWFLLASAVFRDGLAGVFTFGAVIAARVFGFEFLEFVVFGIAANLIAGVSTIVSGRFDDRFGPRAVIVTSSSVSWPPALRSSCCTTPGPITFWIGGLILCAFVGPAQAAARSFLARVTPAGREGEIFGLYATTGRAASFLSPLLWAGFIVALGATFWDPGHRARAAGRARARPAHRAHRDRPDPGRRARRQRPRRARGVPVGRAEFRVAGSCTWGSRAWWARPCSSRSASSGSPSESRRSSACGGAGSTAGRSRWRRPSSAGSPRWARSRPCCSAWEHYPRADLR
ncbi:MAG: MFS transporter [Schumannella sp.]